MVSMEMSLSHAILAALEEEPATGYDLAKRFDGSLGFFWPATHQQIYRELEALAKRRQVTFRTVPGKGRPDRKVFAPTEAGRRALAAWLELPVRGAPAKSELLVKLFAGTLVGDETLRRHVEDVAREKRARLEKYRALEKEHFTDRRRLARKARLQHLTLRRGIVDCESWLAWCAEAASALGEK